MDHIARDMVAESLVSKNHPASPPVTFGIVGNGWRAGVFIRNAYLQPDRFRVTGMVARRPEAGEQFEAMWNFPTFRTLEEMLADERPDFVIVSVPWPMTPVYIRQLVDLGIPVLAETPPAPDMDGLRSLVTDVASTGLVQVAEQYAIMPLHAARVSLANDGTIGIPTYAHVSSTHLYHAVSMMRRLLNVGREPVAVLSQAFHAPLIDPVVSSGWKHDLTPQTPDPQITLSTIDFGGGRLGLYDFVENQWWNPVRPDHLLVRGSAGEISDETVTHMLDDVTPVSSKIERSMTGLGMNYEGLDFTYFTFEGRVIWRNEYEGARLSDDEIGVAELLTGMARMIHEGGPQPYPLVDAAHDHAVGLAIDASIESGERVTVTDEPWME